jgi:hypothetical protein
VVALGALGAVPNKQSISRQAARLSKGVANTAAETPHARVIA